MRSLNYYRSSGTVGQFAKAALFLAVPSTSYPPMSRLPDFAVELYSPVGRRRAGSRELLEGDAVDQITLAHARYYAAVAFQTDTNCSSNKHRRANPRTFIKVRKDERRDSHKRPSRAGLVWLAQGEVVRPLRTPGVFSS